MTPGPFEGAALFPADVLTCDTGAVLTTTQIDENLYDEAAGAVLDVFNQHSSTCSADTCPRADFVGCVVRLAGHDLMDFRIHDPAAYVQDGSGTSGGSDGCIDLGGLQL